VTTGASSGIGAELAELLAARGDAVVLVARRAGMLADVAARQGISRMPTRLTDEDVDAMMDVNVKSVLYGMQEVLPHFRVRGDGQVVNVSSLLGRNPFATLRSACCGAKHWDVYTRRGCRARIAAYYASLGEDPA